MRLLFEDYDHGSNPYCGHLLEDVGRQMKNCADRLGVVLKTAESSDAFRDVAPSLLNETGERRVWRLLMELSVLFEEMRLQMCGSSGRDEKLASKKFYRHMMETVLNCKEETDCENG